MEDSDVPCYMSSLYVGGKSYHEKESSLRSSLRPVLQCVIYLDEGKELFPRRIFLPVRYWHKRNP
ncbi:Uncharacterized protein FKW44_010133 [Caligus rogercresseyi]|uniref:Uncharacterized protein n=1 Tax=Caligus rogercresseyi TaxID=217165 RepID=A0A7T8HGA5_CALRO|nr:Uncharacterized protein FKW44_010133 [Caligus rogercresseyi]